MLVGNMRLTGRDVRTRDYRERMMMHATKRAQVWRLCLLAMVAVLTIGNIADGARPRIIRRALQWIPFVGDKEDEEVAAKPERKTVSLPKQSLTADRLPSYDAEAVSVTKTDRASASWLLQRGSSLPAMDSAAARAQAAMGATTPRDIEIRDVPSGNVAVLPPLDTLPSRQETPVALPPLAAKHEISKPADVRAAAPDTISSLTTADDVALQIPAEGSPEGSSPADRLSQWQPAAPSGPAAGELTSAGQYSAAAGTGVTSPDQVTLPTSGSTTDPVAEYRRLQQAQASAKTLLERGYALVGSDPTSASNEFLRCIATIAESRDRIQGMTLRSESLRNGIAGMIERDLLEGALPEGPVVVASVVGEFQTPVGKALQANETTEQEALAAYPDFIKQSFVVAVGESPLASEALAGLARVHFDRLQNDEGLDIDRQRMLVLLETAISVDEANWRAANELGIAKAKSGLLAEARQVFEKCVASHATQETLNNLAWVCQQQGDRLMAQSYQRRAASLEPSQALAESAAPSGAAFAPFADATQTPLNDTVTAREEAVARVEDTSSEPAKWYERLFRRNRDETAAAQPPPLNAARPDSPARR